MHHEEHWLQTLGLEPGATKRQIDDAYHDLVKVWHPDRFESDPSLRLKAEEKLRELNGAYDRLQRSGTPRTDPSTAAPAQGRSAPTDEPATPNERPSRRKEIRIFAGVLVATAVVVGALLFVERRRDTATAADVFLGTGRDTVTSVGRPVAPDATSRRAEHPPAERSGTEAPVPPAPSAPTPTTGTLAVFSQPSGATVYVNDRQIGETPLTLTAIVPGVHRIRLELEDFPVWSSSVRIEAGSGEKLLAIFEKDGRP